MTTFSCDSGTCPDALSCINKNQCVMSEKPIIKIVEPHNADESNTKRIDEMDLEDYRRGVAKVMTNLR